MGLFSRLLKVRRQEAFSVFLMAGYFFLAMASVNLVKSLQNALYLGRVGFDVRLPVILVILAVLSAPVVMIYRWLGERFSNVWINGLTLLVLAANLVGFSLLAAGDHEWVYPVFYMWGGIVSVLLPMLGWVISYTLFTTRQAKRLFAVLGAGGILGGIFGGYYAALGASALSSEAMMLHVALLLGVMLALLVSVWRHNRDVLRRRDPAFRDSRNGAESRSGMRPGEGLKGLLDSSYLRTLAATTLLVGLVTTFIDLQYKWQLQIAYPGSEREIARFFGGLLGTSFVLSALLQLFATSRVLGRFGVGAGLILLPASLAGGSMALLAGSAFWASAGLRLTDASLRNSLYRTTSEILFMPVSGPDTVAVKGVIDLMASRIGDALAAAGFLVAVLYLGASAPVVGVLVAAGAGAWLVLAFKLREGYLQTLRKSLEIKADPSSRRAFRTGEAVAERTLVEALESSNASKVRFALSQLAAGQAENGGESGYTLSGDAMVQSIYESERPSWLERVEPLLGSRERAVAAAAFAVMVRYRPEEYQRRLKDAMRSREAPDLIYLDYLYEYEERPSRYLEPDRVLHWCREAGRQEAVALARLMGRSRHPAFREQLLHWARRGRSVRARAAIEAIGRYQDPQAVDLLVARLAENWSRRCARRALACYGDSVVARLSKLLRSSDAELDIKREIPYILAQINTREARGALVAALYLPDATLSYRALKGLNKIRDQESLSYNQASFLPLLQLWAKQYYDLLNIDLVLTRDGNAGSKLLRSTVHQRMEWTIEKIFRALGLFFPGRDAYFSYIGYTSDRSELRANAVELIESRMPGELRRTLLPIFTEDDPRQVIRQGRELFGLPSDPARILKEALFERDPWLKVCILAALRHQEPNRFEASVRQAQNDVNPRVRETARWVLEHWKSDQTDQSAG